MKHPLERPANVEVKMQAARELIKEKKLLEARAVLSTIQNDPTATRWIAKIDSMRREYDSTYAPPQAISSQAINMPETGTFGFFRGVWGLLFLVSIAGMCYGTMASAGDPAMEGRSEAYQAGAFLGGFSFVLCIGVPAALIFGLLYWRNGVAIREAKRHVQTIQAMQGR